MPTYDYRCTECGREIEVMHGINENGPESCQHCGGAMRKALSPPAIHFKGSGWAKKDAASSAKKSSTASKGDGGAASSTSDKGGSDAAASPSAKDSDADSGSKSKAASAAGSSTD